MDAFPRRSRRKVEHIEKAHARSDADEVLNETIPADLVIDGFGRRAGKQPTIEKVIPDNDRAAAPPDITASSSLRRSPPGSCL